MHTKLLFRFRICFLFIFLPLLFSMSSSIDVQNLFSSGKTGYKKSLASNRLISSPAGLAFNSNGSLYFSDFSSIRIFLTSNTFDSVEVFAGNGFSVLKPGAIGENAGFSSIDGICFDSKGNLFATQDKGILVFPPNGQLTLYSGVLISNFFESINGHISTARWALPFDLTIDKDDNIYVVEQYWDYKGGNQIRKIATSGMVTTLAGGEYVGFRDGQGSEAQFNCPRRITLDNQGNILISDVGNHAIRILNSTGYVSTITGFSGTLGFIDGKLDVAKFNNPGGLAVDQNDEIYVADIDNNVVRKINTKLGIVETVIGDGQPGFFDGLGKEAQLKHPVNVLFSPNGNLVIADQYNSAIREYNLKSKFVSTLIEKEGQGFQDGFGANALISTPYSMTVDRNDNLLVSDSGNNVIRKVTPEGYVTTYAGFGEVSGYKDGRSTEALFSDPEGIVIDNDDNVYILDSGNHRVRIVYPNKTVSTIAGSGIIGDNDGYGLEASFSHITFATIDNDLGVIYIADLKNQYIRRMNISTGYVEKWAGIGIIQYANGFRLNAGVNDPTGLCVDKDGTLYFTDQYNEIRKIGKDGIVSSVAGNPYSYGFADGVGSNAKFFFPLGIACYPSDYLFVADQFNQVIRKVSTVSQVVTTIVGSVMTRGSRNGLGGVSRICNPTGITADSKGNIYISEACNNVIKKWDPITGRVSSIAGYGAPFYLKNTTITNSLKTPRGLAVNPVTGIIYVADTEHNTILTWEDDQMKIFAGLSSCGWFDNPNDLRDSEFFFPYSIAFSANGSKLFVADTFNHVIREVTLAGVQTIAGIGDFGLKNGPALSASFNFPKYLVVDKAGNIYVSDSNNHIIRKITYKVNIVSQVVGSGVPGFKNGRSSLAQLSHPIGLAFDDNENLFIADSLNHAIRFLNMSSNILSTIAGTGQPGFQDGPVNATFRKPTAVAIKSRSLYVSDSGNDAIRLININTLQVTTFIDKNSYSLKKPADIKFDHEGNLLVLDSGNNALKRIIQLDNIATSVVEKSDLVFDKGLIIIFSSVGFVLFAAIVTFFIKQRSSFRSKHSTKLTNIERLQTIGARVNVDNSVTVNVTKSVAISLPGHLLITKIEKHFLLDVNDNDHSDSIKSGSTATVRKGRITNPKLIAKHGIYEIAIKFVAGDPMKDNSVYDSFRYEVSILNSLPDSPFLVKMIGYSMKPMAIIMKFYPLSFAELISDDKFLENVNTRFKCSQEIAMGMELVHSKNIVHFDLKPGNILVDMKRDLDFNLVICDFGFADYAKEAGKQLVAGMKKPSAIGITPRYAAPELFLKAAMNIDDMHDYRKVDVYAYSMILYQLWTGIKPWQHLNPEFIGSKVLSGERPDFPKDSRLLLNSIKDLIHSCWDSDPLKRPTFTEIISLLQIIKE